MKTAIFNKKLQQLTYWDSHNTQVTHYCPRLAQAKKTLQMLEITKNIKQTLATL